MRINSYKLFDKLEDKDIKLFIDKISYKSFNKSDIIMKENDLGDSILFLLSGEITITKALTLSTNKIDLNDLREKEFTRYTEKDKIVLGEISLFNNDNKRTATVKALSDCEIAYLKNEDFFRICHNNKEIGYTVYENLLHIVTKKLITTNHQLLKLTTAFSLVVDN